MKFRNFALDDLIAYLNAMKSAPSDRLDHSCVPRVRGEIFVENGERRTDGSVHSEGSADEKLLRI